MSYIGNQPYTASFLVDTKSGDGTTTAFTLTIAPANTSSCIVAITGVLQDPSTYSVSGTTLTFSAAPPSGTSNISVRYLGIPASGVTTTAYRTVTEFTATSGQTSFSVPSYTVGYIDVYRNGVMLGTADFTATTGTTVVLASGATTGDLIRTESFYVSSVLNAIPATAGSVSTSYLVDGSVTQAKLATGVAGNGPSFAAYQTSGGQSIPNGTGTKVQFQSEEWDTANCFDSTTNYRFTPNVAGYYQLNAQISYNSFTPSETQIQIYKNGSAIRRGNRFNAAGSPYLVISSMVYANGSTDYFEIYTYQASGSAQTLENLDVRGNYFNGFLARSA